MTTTSKHAVPSSIIVMGVSGSGKSTIGECLAKVLDADFIDGDDLHPAANITKMSRGEALSDEDRLPWLKTIATHAEQRTRAGNSVVIVCSTLKKQYRDIFRTNMSRVQFVFLDGRFDVIKCRMEARQGHFMKVSMLESQFATLERPDEQEPDVYTADVERPVEQLIRDIRHHLHPYRAN